MEGADTWGPLVPEESVNWRQMGHHLQRQELRLGKVKWPRGRMCAARSTVDPELKPGDGSQHWRVSRGRGACRGSARAVGEKPG